MASAANISSLSVAWWKEPTKDQWLAWFAGAFGWMLDGFDFTIFLLIMVPIANEFGVSVTAVASVLTVTLWLRLIGAIGSGWLGDRVGRKPPLRLPTPRKKICQIRSVSNRLVTQPSVAITARKPSPPPPDTRQLLPCQRLYTAVTLT